MKILAVILLVVIAAGVKSYEDYEDNIVNYVEIDMEESNELASRNSALQWGFIGPDDRLISNTVHEASGLEFLVNDQELTYRGSKNTNITSIVVWEYYSNSTEVNLLDGGLYKNYVTLGIKGRRSQYFGCRITIYATIDCSNN